METSSTAYNCYVRPAGQLTHEVPKLRVSAQEIVLLRYIHGSDGVVRITEAGTFKDFDKNTEMRRLAQHYDPGVVARVFNIPAGFLVDEFDDPDAEKEFISYEVVEGEAMGTPVDMKKVAQEAGNHAAAPQAVDTGPVYVTPDAKAVAQESARSME